MPNNIQSPPTQSEQFRKLIFNSIKEIDDYFKRYKQTVKMNVGKAAQWFRNILKEMSVRGKAVDYIIKYPGLFYIIKYESKLYNEDRLLFYDAAPVILLLSVNSHTFLGINWHYILPLHRALILKKLIHYDPKNFFEDKRMMMSWRIFKNIIGTNNLKFVQFAIKRYRFDHLRTYHGVKVMRIKNTEIINTISLIAPVFIGMNNRQVLAELKKHTYHPSNQKTRFQIPNKKHK